MGLKYWGTERNVCLIWHENTLLAADLLEQKGKNHGCVMYCEHCPLYNT